jgi:alkylmercury lyase-like protein
MLLELRRRVFRHFADTGEPPELSREELALLAERRAVVLDASGGIEFANPFATGPTDFVVRAVGRRWYATCTWDGLGILALLGEDGHVETNCPDCDEPLELVVHDGDLQPTESVVHFLVPAAQWYDDLRFT